MITFENGLDIRCRQVENPQVARIQITLAANRNVGEVYRYCVIGTPYGFWHTSGGDVRTWQTYSGARRALLRYVPI